MKIKTWNKNAIQWDSVGPPLRPCDADIARLETTISKLYPKENHHKKKSALLLGVTPEITGMAWPENTQLLAVDRMMAMITHVWPGSTEIEAEAICGDWMQLPLQNKWADLVIGDGSFTFFSFPEQYRQMVQELKRIMADGAYLLVRFFVQAEEKETSAEVFADLYDGKIANFHVFKWRLTMSLQQDLSRGSCVSDVWDAWNTHSKGAENLAQHLNWPINEINTMESFKNGDTIYYFPDADAVRELLGNDFNEIGVFVENYQLAERCPLMVFQLPASQ